MKKSDLTQEKMQFLEKDLMEKKQMLEKYQQALADSNKRIEEITKELKESLSLVRKIHKNLLPVRLPQISGFEMSFKFQPAQQGVSGDFFDVIKMKNSMNFGVLLSSCNTYAITSLFLSSFLKFTADMKKYKTSKDFLSSVIKKLAPSLKKDEKVHFFYGLISRSSLEMDYCLIGDIFLGKRSQGKKLEVLPPCASPLYGQKEIKLKRETISLQPEDILLICSPGVAQRQNSKGELFGERNLVHSASQNPSAGVLETRQKVLFSCNQFGEKTPRLQDSTVLAIKVEDRILRVHKSSS